MNGNSDSMKKDPNHEQSIPKAELSVLSGNAYADGAFHRGWFIGHFLENTYGLRATPAIEIKWGVHHAGEERSSWGLSEKATTLCILFRGKVQIVFAQEEHILSQEGDYIIWPAGIPHQWKMIEDTLILTIRWPSMPEDYIEQSSFSP